jgi:high affinity sulfate transporter 1
VVLRLFPSLAGYRRSWLQGDVMAGLTVWAMLIPQALAYASIAGVSPVVGLYATPAALLLYAAFGSSRHLVVGPMSATAALSAAAVAELATQGSGEFAALTATLAITAGIIGVVAGLARLGFVANFISEPVLKGFIIGLALMIMVGQVPKLFGVPKGEGNFFERLWHLLGNLDQTSGLTLLVGLGSLALILGLRRVAPMVPGSLVAVVLGIVVVQLFHADRHGAAIVGSIEPGLPSLGLPGVAAVDYLTLAPAAVGILLVGFAEGLGAAKTHAARQRYEVDTNRELLGVGAANLGAGLSSAMVVSGSLSKTAVNGAAGARTQLSGLVVAALTIVTLLTLTPLFQSLPLATLAAVVIAAVIELVDIPALAALYRVYTRQLGRYYGVAARPDFIAAVAALVGVLVFDTLPGLFIGIGISLLLLIYRASYPHIAVLGKVPGTAGQYGDLERHPDNQPLPGIVILRVESGLFFANADAVRQFVRAHAAQPGTRVVVLDAETVPAIDVTAVHMLAELTQSLEREGVRLLVAREIGQVRDVVRRVATDELPVGIYPTLQAAVQAAQQPPDSTSPDARRGL